MLVDKATLSPEQILETRFFFDAQWRKAFHAKHPMLVKQTPQQPINFVHLPRVHQLLMRL